jgi:hypothetical protein
MSSWGKKLEKKLNGLADTASKESIQTLSNWIAFNRKHAQTIATVLTNALQDFKDNEKRQWLFWQIIHEILVRERGNEPKWEKLGQLRLTLGEALQPAMKSLGNTMPEQLESYVEEWEDHDVFGGPSLNAQIRRIYQSRKNLTTVDSTKATKASVSPTEKASVSSATETQASSTISTALGQTTSQTPKLSAKASTISGGGGKDQSTKADTNNKTGQNDNDDDEVAGKNIGPSEEAHGKSPSPQRRNSALKEQVEYDFESKVSIYRWRSLKIETSLLPGHHEFLYHAIISPREFIRVHLSLHKLAYVLDSIGTVAVLTNDSFFNLIWPGCSIRTSRVARLPGPM